MLEQLINHADFWKYVSIPIVAALVGWGTNWIAIQMTFYPIKPIGKPPFFGWQGIIPSKASKMGAIATDSVLAKLGDIEDIFESMEPDKITSHIVKCFTPQVEQYVESIMLEENPLFWEIVPSRAKTRAYAQVRRKLPKTVHQVVSEIGKNIGETFDIKDIVMKELQEDKEVLNRIFLECGAEEFKFIVNSGIYFGFFFGLVQMLIWFLYPAWWILPFFGLLVGYATNWLALRIIFQPVKAKTIGPFTIQGLFLKRQKEVAEIWCRIVTHEILTVGHITDAMLHGAKSERTNAIVRKHIRKTVDEVVGITKPATEMALGVKQYLHIKETSTEKAIELSVAALNDPIFSEDRAEIVKQMMVERMVAMPSEEFQNLLRPAFQEDELKLILLGALLGLLAGIAQLFLVFGG
jgi:uncharacterized membrane protein YheB (UPF0754 family)